MKRRGRGRGPAGGVKPAERKAAAIPGRAPGVARTSATGLPFLVTMIVSPRWTRRMASEILALNRCKGSVSLTKSPPSKTARSMYNCTNQPHPASRGSFPASVASARLVRLLLPSLALEPGRREAVGSEENGEGSRVLGESRGRPAGLVWAARWIGRRLES